MFMKTICIWFPPWKERFAIQQEVVSKFDFQDSKARMTKPDRISKIYTELWPMTLTKMPSCTNECLQRSGCWGNRTSWIRLHWINRSVESPTELNLCLSGHEWRLAV